MTADRKPLKDITAVTEAIMAEHAAYATDKTSITEYINGCVAEVVKLKMYLPTLGTVILASNPPRNGIELVVNGPRRLWLAIDSRSDKDYPVYFETRDGTFRSSSSSDEFKPVSLSQAIDSFPNILDAGMAIYAFQLRALKAAKDKSADMKIKADNIAATKKKVYKAMADSYKTLYEEFQRLHDTTN